MKLGILSKIHAWNSTFSLWIRLPPSDNWHFQIFSLSSSIRVENKIRVYILRMRGNQNVTCAHADGCRRQIQTCRLFHISGRKYHPLERLDNRPSVLWHCWLGGRKGIRPVKKRVVGCWRGYLSGVRRRLAYGPADATATHCLLLQ